MFIRFMICLVVIAIAAPFMIPGPNGTPIMTLDMLKFYKPSVSLPDINLGGSDQGSGSASQSMYRYQDENGVWHFSDQAPENGSAEQVQLNSDINLMEARQVQESRQQATTELPISPLTAITRGAEVMEDAQAVQQLMDDRVDQMDQSLNGIR